MHHRAQLSHSHPVCFPTYLFSVFIWNVRKVHEDSNCHSFSSRCTRAGYTVGIYYL
jgi:hypothetical protein